jgi:hypothetical protein
MEAGAHCVRMYFVEGYHPRGVFRSAVSPEQELILTVLANTGRTLWPRYRENKELVAP